MEALTAASAFVVHDFTYRDLLAPAELVLRLTIQVFLHAARREEIEHAVPDDDADADPDDPQSAPPDQGESPVEVDDHTRDVVALRYAL